MSKSKNTQEGVKSANKVHLKLHKESLRRKVYKKRLKKLYLRNFF